MCCWLTTGCQEGCSCFGRYKVQILRNSWASPKNLKWWPNSEAQWHTEIFIVLLHYQQVTLLSLRLSEGQQPGDGYWFPPHPFCAIMKKFVLMFPACVGGWAGVHMQWGSKMWDDIKNLWLAIIMLSERAQCAVTEENTWTEKNNLRKN